MSSTCAMGFTSEDISNWRAGLVSAAQRQDMEAHVPACSSCQRIDRAYAQIATSLARPPHLPSQDEVWRGVRQGMTNARGNGRNRTVWFGSLGALAIVALAFAVFVTLLPSRSATTPPITKTAAPSATPTLTPKLGLKPGTSWTAEKAFPNGMNAAFAASAPLTGYACGASASSGKTLDVYTTQDGGGSWHAIANGITGRSCLLTINPTDPNDVIMLGSACFYGCGDNPFIYPYRSTDGGKTWASLALPPGAEAPFTTLSDPMFAGDAVYVTAMSSSSLPDGLLPSLKHSLAVSVNYGPFTWVDLSQFTLGGSVNGFSYAFGNAFYLVVGPHAQQYLEQTQDGGATWTKMTTTGIDPALLNYQATLATDASALYLQTNDGFYKSTDGKVSWSKVQGLPALPPNTALYDNGHPVAVAPDQTIYMADVEGVIYRARPGDSAWRQLQPTSGMIPRFQALSCDLQGRPVALWAQSLTAGANGQAISALVYLAA